MVVGLTETMSSLEEVLANHAIVLPDEAVAQIDRYCRLLWDWNTRLNLTRHGDFERFVARDLTDSMAVAKLLEPQEVILDLGTGGGVPGVLLAILRSDLHVSLCESVGKRAAAVGSIVDAMDLSVPVYRARAEDLLADFRCDTVVARAVGSMVKVLRWVRPHWESFGRLLLVKGPRWVDERGQARHGGLLQSLELRRVASYPMPGTDSESVILQIQPIRGE